MKATIQGLSTSVPTITLIPETLGDHEAIGELGAKLRRAHSVHHGGFKYMDKTITLSITPVDGTRD